MAPHFDRPIITELSPAEVFFSAEDYHQDYCDQNSSAGYRTTVIMPKLAKLRKMQGEKLKVTV